ncbi:MAG: RNA polymerase subunit sigma, partial [Caldilinea sp.]|nr:RNA polymerase subunit sigma [Caldilinea sp.]
MRASFENDFDVENEDGFEVDLHEETEIEGELEGVGESEGETPVALSPEAALEHLMTLGRSQGYVTYDDVLKVMPEAESNMEQLEDVFASLFEQGIEVGQAREEDHDVLGDVSDAEIETVEVEEEDFDL